MEAVGDSIPPPWGTRIEFVFGEIGGFIWLQITLTVILLRVILSSIASVWRLLQKRDASI
jgi:heme exporter protein D